MGELFVNIPNSIYVQFSDFDGTDNNIPDVPLHSLPRVGDNLNIRHEGMTYFLKVESFTHFVDCETCEGQPHSVTIDCKLVGSRAKDRIGGLG